MHLRRWLLMATGALMMAGVFALMIALARMPAVELALGGDYFYTALVAHVDLALVIWFLLLAVIFWKFTGASAGSAEPVALALCGAGAGMVVLTALAGWGEPVMSNYVPFLRHPLFSIGLAVFALGIAVMAVPTLRRGLRSGASLPEFGAAMSAGGVLAGLAALVLAGVKLIDPAGIEVGGMVFLPGPEQVIGALFWGVGHNLQFAHAAGMVTIWLLLLDQAGIVLRRVDIVRGALAGYFAGAAVGIAAYVVYDPLTLAESPLMSNLMGYGLGIPTGVVMLLVLEAVWTAARRGSLPWRDPGFAAVATGFAAFTVGGAIAVIAGLEQQNTLIPAHYHGVLGAVTLGFMGFTYNVLRAIGHVNYSKKWSYLHSYFYGLGVLGFVAGMAWAGGYGAPRKTPGLNWTEDPVVFLALNLMGVGALMMVVGGATYVLNTARALLNPATVVFGDRARHGGTVSADRAMQVNQGG